MKTLIAVIGLSLIVAACGGSNAEADELAEAIGEKIWEESQGDEDVPFEFERADADCMGHAFVDAIGYDTLTEAGVTAEAVRSGAVTDPFQDTDIPDESAGDVYDGISDCIDLAGALAEAMAPEMGVSLESAECFIEGLIELEAFRTSMVAAMLGDDDSPDPFDNPDPTFVGVVFDLMNDCLTDEELARVIGS